MGIKLSAKFARQESEEARLARIARKRVPTDRIETIRRMLGLPEPERETLARRRDENGTVLCPECNRAFALPMHLGRHKKAKHQRMTAGRVILTPLGSLEDRDYVDGEVAEDSSDGGSFEK